MKSIHEWKAEKMLEDTIVEFDASRLLSAVGMTGESISSLIRNNLTRLFAKVIPVLQKTMPNEEILKQILSDVSWVLAHPGEKMPAYQSKTDVLKNLNSVGQPNNPSP